jgi:hypothetical protein
MDSHPDVMQQAADEAGGYEGKRVKHNCKTGEVLLDGVAIGPLVRIVFFMDEATHGWLHFNEAQELIYSDIRRFTVEKPNRDERADNYKPNTGCLAIIESTGQLATYQGASWAVRSAFVTQLLKPYVRARKAGILPVVTLSFKEGQRDDHGNYLPDFEIADWVPRARYAMILGEVTPLETAALPTPQPDAARLAPATAAKHAAPLPVVATGEAIARGKMTVTSGKAPDEPPPPIDNDDGYSGVDPNDKIPF